MKKIILIFIMLFLTDYVKAKEPKIEYIDNVYSNRISSDQVLTGQLGYIYIDGQIAFCIEPFKIIGNNYEINNEVINQFYTEEEQRKIQLIVHYGAGSHLNDPYYYMATQELIWRIKGEGDYYFTNSSVDGDKIDIEDYKNDILEKVEKHSLLPSFNNITLTPKLYDNIELIDENNVVNKYDALNLSNNKVTKIRNGINIKITDSNETNITLSYRVHSGITSNTYVGNGQTLIISSIMEEQKANINIKPEGISYYLKIKFLEDNRSIFGKIKFKIYNHNTSQYIENGRIFESNMFGVYDSDFKLDLGTYEIAYVDIPKGYIPSASTNKFILTENTQVNSDLKYEFTSYLDVPKGKLTITRNVELYGGFIKNLNEIEYKIYASANIYDAHSKLLYEKDEFVSKVVTIDGKAEVILPLGRYYIEEQINQYNIPVSSNKNITFNYKDSITEMYYEKINITSYLPILTIDIKTIKENIDGSYNSYSNYQYELYASEDIIYLNEIIFKKGELIKSFTSNIDGYIYEHMSLPYGKYEIREVNIDNNYYECENIVYSFTSVDNYLNALLEKKLKRGNMKINIISDKDDRPNNIYFIYDKEYMYNIENELLINNIKIGEYKVIYDKEYYVTINPNETTILNIEIEEVIEKNEVIEDDNNKVKNNEINDSKDEIDYDELEENNNINDTEDKIDKDSENSNNQIYNEENKEVIIDDIIEIPYIDLEIKKDNDETLPNTYNYLKKYYCLFYIFILIGISIKFYEKNN